MKILAGSLFVFFVILNFSYADGGPGDGDFGDDYGGNTPGTSIDLNDRYRKDVRNMACEGNLCRIFNVEVRNRRWTIGVFGGVNDGMGGGRGGRGGRGGGGGGLGGGGGFGGGGGYGGGYGGFGGGNGNGNNNTISAGIEVTYENEHCSKTINVDQSVYRAITTYMRSLVNEDGTTRPAFTPSEQTMILFYTTIMQLTHGFNCNG